MESTKKLLLSVAILFFALTGFCAFTAPDNGSTTGGDTLTIFIDSPEDFGTEAGTVTIGGLNVAVISWSSQSIEIITNPGVGANQPVIINPVFGPSIESSVFSYDPPSITSASMTLFNGAGGETVMLSGSNFGTAQLGTPEVRIDGKPAIITMVDHASITFIMPSGSGTNVPIQYRIGGQLSNEFLVSYKAPILVKILDDDICTEGGDTVVIFGLHFGDGSNPPIATIGGFATQTIWVSDHLLYAITPSFAPTETRTTVTVGGQISNTISFPKRIPEIISVSPSEWPTEGGITITVNGKNFSPFDQNEIEVNGSNVPVDIFGPSSLTFIAPQGEGSGNKIKVISDGITSNTFEFNYIAPQLVSLSPSPVSPFGGSTITLNGTNLGNDNTTKVFIDGSEVTNISVTGGNTIEFSAPVKVGTNLPVYVEVGNQQSNSLLLSYEAPMLTAIIEPVSNDENTILQVFSNFSIDNNSDIKVFINGGQHFSFFAGPATFLIQDLPPGGGSGNEIYVIIDGVQTNSLTFDYPAPVINSISPVQVSPGELLTVSGNFFGIDGAPVQAFLNGILLDVFKHTPTELQFIIPPGTGTDLPFFILIGNQPSNSLLVSYVSPGHSEEVQVLGSLKIENLGAALGNTVLAIGVDGKVSKLILPRLKVSTTGDTLHLGKDQFVIIPGISEANRQ